MKKAPLWMRSVCLALSLLLAMPPVQLSVAQEPGDPELLEVPGPELPPGRITAGGMKAEDYAEGLGDVLLPILFDGANLLFLNPRSSFTDRSEEEYNLGLGYRRLIRDQQAIAGLNAFFDHRETSLGSSFDQVGFGAEYLSRLFDARANVYLPLDDEELVRTYDVSESSTSQRASQTTRTLWGDPYAEGNDILQPYQQVTTTRVRTTTTTTTRTFQDYELALQGWDAEVGVPVPMASIEDYARAKVFGGYYSYDGERGAEDVDGFRGRLEVQLKPSLFVDAIYYADDNLTGGNYSVGLYVSLPFEIGQIAAGRNPFAGASDLWNAPLEDETLSYRLAEMVRRDPQIRTLLSEPEFVPGSERVSSRSIVRSSSEKTGSGIAEVETDITFVDGNVGDDANPGTFEAPKLTIQGGVDFPRSMVFVFDTGASYMENVVMTDGVVLRGEGSPIVAFGGKTFGSGVHPTVDGMSQGPAIAMANDTSVTGFRILNTVMAAPAIEPTLPTLGAVLVNNVGLLGNDVTGLAINENIIEGNSFGILIDRLGDLEVSLFGNTIQNNSLEGAVISGMGASGTFGVFAEGNAFNDNAVGGLYISGFNYDEASVWLADNASSRNVGGSGTVVKLQGDFVAQLHVAGHTANDNAERGLVASLDSPNGAVLATVSDSTFNDNDSGGTSYAGLDLNATADTISLIGLGGIEANGNGSQGVHVSSVSSGLSLVLGGLHPELVQFGSALGLGDVLPPELAPLFQATGGLQADGNGESGLQILSQGDSLALLAVFDASASGNGDIGGDFAVSSPNGVALGLVADTGTLLDVVELGLGVADSFLGPLGLPALPDVPADYMAFNGNAGHGFELTAFGDTLGLALAMGVEAGSNGGLGAFLGASSPNGAAIGIGARMLLDDNGDHGLYAPTIADSFALNVLLDIRANRNANDGIHQYVESDSSAAIAVLASTDPIRSLVDVLNDELGIEPPVLVPGDPFGPVTTLQNGGRGVFSTVRSDGLGVAVLLDVQANYNGMEGLRLIMDSDNASSFGLVGSSDLLFELAPTLLGADPVAFDPIGRMQLNGNLGGGLRASLESDDSSTFMAGGIDALNNENNVFDGDGFIVEVAGGTDVHALLTDLYAEGNFGSGLRLVGSAQGDAAFGVFSSTFSNNDIGLDMDVETASGNLYTLLAGVTSSGNTRWGTRLLADSGGLFAGGVSQMEALGNGNQGLRVVGTAAGNVDFGLGNGWVRDMTDAYDIPVFSYLDDLEDVLIPAGGSELSGNGLSGGVFVLTSGDALYFSATDLTLTDNGNNGLRANLSAQGFIQVNSAYNTASNNVGSGFRYLLSSGTANASINFYESTSVSNGSNGVFIDTAAAGTNFVLVTDNVLTGNAQDGARILLNGGLQDRAFGSRNVMTDNGRYGLFVNASGASQVLNFGQDGGVFGDNVFFGNGVRDVRNAGLGTLFVENNWWGADTDPVANGQTQGPVDADPWLPADPNP